MMMTPDEARKIDNLLNLDTPKSERVARAHHPWTEYMNYGHFIGVRVRDRGQKEPFYACGGEDDVKTVDVTKRVKTVQKEGHTTRINRKHLLEVLKNMDSESVEITTTDTYPVIVRGTVGSSFRYVTVIIAPMLMGEFEEDEENINPDEPKEESNDG